MSDQDKKPVLDPQTFEKLLEAGYVLQEHTRKMRELEDRMQAHSDRLREQDFASQPALPKPDTQKSSRPVGDYTLTLAEIVEAQRQIQARHLDLDKTLAVIAEKVAHIAGATGAGIGLLEEKIVRYRAGAGAPALPVGSEVPLAIAICAASVRTGQVIRSDDVNTEVLFDPEPCRERGILSLVAVPIYHDGDIVGGLELYFDRLRGYAEQDIHTCQLMAGLVTEAIGREAESKLKKSMAAERSSMLAAIEKLQPLAELAQDQSASASKANTGGATESNSPWWKCGNNLLAEEQFCGKCGAPRDNSHEPASMQSKVASAWHKQQIHEGTLAAPTAPFAPLNGKSSNPSAAYPPAPPSAKFIAASHPSTEENVDDEIDTAPPTEAVLLPQPSTARSLNASAAGAEETLESEIEDEGVEEGEPLPGALAKAPPEAVWSSASKAREFLESLSGARPPNALARFWQSRRGDFYLAVALILVIAVIRWGMWSDHPVGATNHGNATAAAPNRKPAPNADLSTFDKLLIGLGLAEAPEPPENKGNPDTQVWIDLHTALYYCPGSDLYGKTPKGRIASQRDAQLDQFEPADRKPCD